MQRPHSAQYGDSLQTAAAKALVSYQHDLELMSEIRISANHYFDFHGLHVRLTPETTAQDLVDEVTEAHKLRAELYALSPAPADAFEREQGGRIGESLEECVLPSIQCAQRWGNGWFNERDDEEFGRLRHVFEFNGVRVAFNPWAVGEPERVMREALEQLSEQRAIGNAVPDVVVPGIVPALEFEAEQQ